MAEFKRPQSVLVVVHTTGGEVLLLRRRYPADFWQSITGSLERGEQPRHAAQRELYEETGLHEAGRLIDCRQSRTFPIKSRWRPRYAPGAGFNREYWFRLELPHRRHIRLNPEEHSEYRWLPIVEAARLASSWTNRGAILSLNR